jgi:ribonuclease Z
LKHSATDLKYDLNFEHIQPVNGKIILDHEDFTVSTLQMNHRIPCAGFLFREKNTDRRIIRDALAEYKIDVAQIQEIKAGKDYVAQDGTIVKNDLITDPPHRERSYAFCTDTSFQDSLIPFIRHIDLLYHEATFTSELQSRAVETFHSTAKEAALIAEKAEVKKLLLGHFSARYRELDILLNEAKSVFQNTELAIEGETFFVERD